MEQVTHIAGYGRNFHLFFTFLILSQSLKCIFQGLKDTDNRVVIAEGSRVGGGGRDIRGIIGNGKI